MIKSSGEFVWVIAYIGGLSYFIPSDCAQTALGLDGINWYHCLYNCFQQLQWLKVLGQTFLWQSGELCFPHATTYYTLEPRELLGPVVSILVVLISICFWNVCCCSLLKIGFCKIRQVLVVWLCAVSYFSFCVHSLLCLHVLCILQYLHYSTQVKRPWIETTFININGFGWWAST